MAGNIEYAKQDSKLLDNLENKLDSLYVITSESVNNWADSWVNYKLQWINTNDYQVKLNNMELDFDSINAIKDELESISKHNEDLIQKLDREIKINRDENKELNGRLNTFKNNEDSAVEQLKIDSKMFEETIFMNLLYFFSIISMIIITIQKVYGKP